jgi:hypothetical protein
LAMMGGDGQAPTLFDERERCDNGIETAINHRS